MMQRQRSDGILVLFCVIAALRRKTLLTRYTIQRNSDIILISWFRESKIVRIIIINGKSAESAGKKLNSRQEER